MRETEPLYVQIMMCDYIGSVAAPDRTGSVCPGTAFHGGRVDENWVFCRRGHQRGRERDRPVHIFICEE